MLDRHPLLLPVGEENLSQHGENKAEVARRLFYRFPEIPYVGPRHRTKTIFLGKSKNAIPFSHATVISAGVRNANASFHRDEK